MVPLTNATDRFSKPRNATYLQGFVPNFVPDSRLRFEITNIYFYTNTIANNTNPQGSSEDVLTQHINTTNPGALNEGLPIIFNDNCAPPHYSDYGGPKVFVALGPTNIPSGFFAEQLRHEIGHACGLDHTYGIGPFNCNSPEFLSDVFPCNNPFCNPCSATCSACAESSPNLSNNIMGNASFNEWMSPLQMAIRRRLMYLNYNDYTGQYNQLRQYAKDVISDHVNVWNITASEIWDFDIQMYEDIIVKTGATLTLTCKIAMAIGGKIKVEKGAKLIIDGGVITGWCKSGLWNGIEVEGTTGQDQEIYNPTGYCPNQGIVQVINNGLITNAGNGITNCTTDNAGNINWGSSGGIIICNKARFLNNARDVQFLSYQSPMGNDKSNFVNCIFQTGAALVGNALPFARVSLWDVRGVSFKNCKFWYAAGTTYPIGNRGNGIYSIDATYNIGCVGTGTTCTTSKSQFIGFDQGVYVDNTNPLRVVSITNTDFTDNISYGAYFNNVNTPVFTDNYVKTSGLSFLGCGLYLNNCKYFDVKNNTFTGNSSTSVSDIGIYVNNSKDGSHKIYRNSFSKFLVGIGAINDNSGVTNPNDGLLMNCNDFTTNQNAYDITLLQDPATALPPSVMTDQGAIVGQTQFNLVRNKYGATNLAGIENQWYIDGVSAKSYNHGSNLNSFTQPLPQPPLSDVDVFVFPSNISLNYTLHCPPNTIAVNPCP